MLVGVIYRIPGSSEANNEKLNQTITKAVGLNHSHILLMGDFNDQNIKWDSESAESNTVEDKFIENIRDNFLLQHIVQQGSNLIVHFMVKAWHFAKWF